MLKVCKRFVHAFLYDEARFLRWTRSVKAGVAMVLCTVFASAGTDFDEMIAEVQSWRVRDWIFRLILGLLFSSVYSSPKPAAVPETAAARPGAADLVGKT
jgi:hypothetical protein